MRAESTIRTTLIAAAATCAVCLPSAYADGPQDLRNADQQAPVSTAVKQDLRSPDRVAPQPAVQQDLRSPDRVAPQPATPDVRTVVRTDLRSPDAVDAGRDIVRVPAPVSAVAVDGSDGFEWGDAGIGAGVICCILALLGGAFVLTRRRHGSMGTPAVS